MSYEYINTYFLLNESLDENGIRNLIDHCFKIGCTTQEGTNSQQCWYIGKATDYDYTEIDIETAITDLATTEGGSIQLWFEGMSFLLGPYVDTVFSGTPCVWLGIDPTYFKISRHSTDSLHRNAHSLANLSSEIASFLSPVHVCGYESSIEHCPDQEPLFDVTLSELADGYVDRLFWLNIFNPAAVERLGRDELLTAPVWRTEELAGGSVLFIVNDTPLYFEEDPAPLAERLGLRPPTL